MWWLKKKKRCSFVNFMSCFFLSLVSAGNDEQKENVFLQQTLEEFYQTADAMYPPREVRPVSRSRVKSAPAVGRHRSQSQPSRITSSATAGPELSKRKMTPQPNRLGHLLKDFSVEEWVKDALLLQAIEGISAIFFGSLYQKINDLFSVALLAQFAASFGFNAQCADWLSGSELSQLYYCSGVWRQART